MSYQRKPAETRKSEILEAALRMGGAGLFTCITREEIAARLGIAPTLVTYHWGLEELRDTVLAVGCERGVPRLVVEAVVRGHPAAEKLSAAAKSKAINAVR